ncbi:RES domain-containing protein [Pseudomonas sp. C1C7]|uniref:RES family NAD+ phosphorylase n=1 Tax=Pseudomonas sp. C1C7 TaxID=2735272 RepID=UPI001586AD39|nr:RES domain-containing protein [Pseudomonas sp. C1C7]NUT77635.1 RES domain-containing protein [Pseudomonas sp. C1C7]
MAKDPLSTDIHFWRIDSARHSATWHTGRGAEIAGGRWNPKGMPIVYGALDAATAILEVAVHKGFKSLDSESYILTEVRILDRAEVLVIKPEDIANQNWLVPGSPSRSQQEYGESLLESRPFVIFPSCVSRHSWNLLMNPALAEGHFEVVLQERFALDGRLNPP